MTDSKHKSTMDRAAKLVDAIGMDDFMSVCESGEYVGYCLSCHEESGEVEPDAENYRCEMCGKLDVFGAEQIVFYIG